MAVGLPKGSQGLLASGLLFCLTYCLPSGSSGKLGVHIPGTSCWWPGLGGTDICTIHPVHLPQSWAALCLSQTFSVDLSTFGICQVSRKLTGSCVFLFPGTN